MSDLCGPDGRLFHASAEAERKLLIQLLTKEEKEFTETITKMCALRTAIAKGATPEDLTLDQCRLVCSVLATNADRTMRERPEDEESPEYLPEVMRAAELGVLAFKWLNIVNAKAAAKEGGQG